MIGHSADLQQGGTADFANSVHRVGFIPQIVVRRVTVDRITCFTLKSGPENTGRPGVWAILPSVSIYDIYMRENSGKPRQRGQNSVFLFVVLFSLYRRYRIKSLSARQAWHNVFRFPPFSIKAAQTAHRLYPLRELLGTP